MKLINYKCKQCQHEEEVLYDDTEEVTETKRCRRCGTRMKQYNFKNNPGRWRYND